MKVIKCNLCGANDYRIISRIGYPFTKQVRNVICKSCGLVCQNLITNPEKLAAFYFNYRKITIDIDTPTEEYEKYAQPMAYYHYSFFKEYCKQGMNILDVGCGAGTLMSWAVKDGLNAYGVNPDPGYGNYGPTHYGLKEVQICMFEDAFFDPKMFDIITFNHVFEHFTDATSMLQKVRHYLKDDGLIYLSIPNVLTPHGQLEYNFLLEHINTFSPTTIRLLLKRNGFKIIKMSTYGYLTTEGLHHPFIDLVARKAKGPIPQPVNWYAESEDYKSVCSFLHNYRKAFLKKNGRIRVYAGILGIAILNLMKNSLVFKDLYSPINAIVTKLFHIYPILSKLLHNEPNYCTDPEEIEFPADKCTYYE